MKKVIGIVVLGLLFCTSAFAYKVKIDSTSENYIKLKRKVPLVSVNAKKLNKAYNKMFQLSKQHCGTKNSYIFTKNFSDGWRADFVGGYRWETYLFFCAKNISEAIERHKNISTSLWNGTLKRSESDCSICGTPTMYFETTASGTSHKNLPKNSYAVVKKYEGQSGASFTTAIGMHSVTCKELGFKHGTEKFGDCVLKLVELDIKRGGNVQAAEQFQRKRQDQGSQMLIELGLGLLSGSSGSTTQTQTNTNQRSTCRWQSGGVGQPYMTCTTY